MFGDSEDRPRDFIVQVASPASPDPGQSEGSAAAPRSERRSDLSGGGARRGA
jgi:hypothetical protein